MHNLIPKPGITLGLYPEKRDDSSSHQQTVSQKSQISLKRVLKKINAEGELIKDTELIFLKEILDDVRFNMIRHGLTEKNIISSFAIIREISSRVLGLRHHDVQVMGAWAMITDNLAEMDTGEGKTLTATLVAGTAALAGIPTHVMTVNAYLSHRDAELMAPLYAELGLEVGVATDLESDDERRQAYACDITYCTSKQIAFDYLRDRMQLKVDGTRLHLQLAQLPEEYGQTQNLFLRGLCFAIVDEADSILADEALNPLVIASEVSTPDQEKLYQQTLSIVEDLESEIDFIVDKKDFKVSITESGENKIAEYSESFGGIWNGKKRRKHLCEMGLCAINLYEKEKHYLVEDDKIKIIDQNTGRLMQDRAWEYGLHQLIETKECCAISGQRNTLAKLTFQRFFRRYLKLAGMSGTLMELSKELKSVYGLKVIRIPTHKSCNRKSFDTWLYSNEQYKWAACIRRIKQLNKLNRPVLIGTRTVSESEYLSELLTENSLEHQVLNARHTKKEAEIIANAGKSSSIIVATNVAGRGTDIVLDTKSKETGGLHVILVEQNDAQRIDRQLFGRCARQGAPGSFEVLLSIEGQMIQQFYPQFVLDFTQKFVSRFGVFPLWLGKKMIRLPQLMIEKKQRRTRYALLKSDEQLGKLLSFAGKQE